MFSDCRVYNYLVPICKLLKYKFYFYTIGKSIHAMGRDVSTFLKHMHCDTKIPTLNNLNKVSVSVCLCSFRGLSFKKFASSNLEKRYMLQAGSLPSKPIWEPSRMHFFYFDCDLLL